MTHGFDTIDRHILDVLQRDGRIANQSLADEVGLSPSACHRRVRRLEEEGVITGYVARLCPEQVGYGSRVFVAVTLERQTRATIDAFEEAVTECPEVMACHFMSGDPDYLLDVVVSDLGAFERVHRERLSRLPGVAQLRSGFTIRTVAERTAYEVRSDR